MVEDLERESERVRRKKDLAFSRKDIVVWFAGFLPAEQSRSRRLFLQDEILDLLGPRDGLPFQDKDPLSARSRGSVGASSNDEGTEDQDE